VARILYGVHGTGHGHAVRALTIARQFPEHEFLFVSDVDGAALLTPEYPLFRCPNPETPIRGHGLWTTAMVRSRLRIAVRKRRLIQELLAVMDVFQPDAALNDLEFFVPRASRLTGLPCLSLDHQHVVTACRHDLPRRKIPGFLGLSLSIRWNFNQATSYLITSFFQPPLRPGVCAVLAGPLLRKQVLDARPGEGEHVLAYHGYSTFRGFYDFLRAIPRPVKVYGADIERQEGNLHFQKRSEQGFVEDLASCSYVVSGASHTLLSEALYLGKPVFAFPIRGAFEQFLNAWYLRGLGYGDFHEGRAPSPSLIRAFEGRLDEYRRRIREARFCGNEDIFARVGHFIRERGLASPGQAGPDVSRD